MDRQAESSDFIEPSVGKIKFGAECDTLWEGKNNRTLNPFIKTMVHKSNMHYSKINQKGNWKKHIKLPLELQKMRPPRHLIQLSTWKGVLGILDIDGQLNSLKTKWIQRLLNPTHAFWKDLMLYWLNLILNSNQGLVLFRQTQILRSTRHKNLQKQSNEDFLYSCLILAYISPTTNLLSPRVKKKFLNSPSF